MRTKILKMDPGRPDKKKIRIAAASIRGGGLVIFPTETVYGIGGDAFNRRAVKRIYRVKGRPSGNPLMVHVSGMEMALRVGAFPKGYLKIVDSLWPGPIAFVVPARRGVPKEVVSGLGTVAIRMPDHKVALELIRESRTPIAAPSANPSKMPSSTKASHATGYFDGKVDVIIDSGSSRKGIESTILDLRTFTVLRPGAFPAEKIAEAFGRKPKITKAARGLATSKVASAPGMRYRHYSPKTPLFLYTGRPSAIRKAVSGMDNYAFIGSRESCRALGRGGVTVLDLGSRKSIAKVASNLFDSLIKVDGFEVDFAIVESFPEGGIGMGVMNRLRKAANHRYFSTRGQLKALISKYAKDD